MEISDHPTTRWVCTWHAGPDAGACRPLAAGRHVLGRAAGAVLRADDPALEPHEALIEARPDGTLLITQLTGRSPIRVDGVAASGTTALAPGSWVEAGNSLLSFGPPPTAANAAHVQAGALLRSPRAVPQWQPVRIAPPEPPALDEPGHGGLIPALSGLAGAGLLALVLHQPMFLIFGALGAAVALAGWVGQRIHSVRRRRRVLGEHAMRVAEVEAARERMLHAFRCHHEATVPTLAKALATITTRADDLWARRAHHDDAFLVAAGLGDVATPLSAPSEDDLADATTSGLAVPVSLAPGARLAVGGPQAHAVARALVVQLVSSCGPADVRIIVVGDRGEPWAWMDGLPHATLPDGSLAVVREHALGDVLADLEGHRGHLLFITDRPALLAARTSPLRRALADPTMHALLAVVAEDAAVPHLCTSTVETTAGPVARWVQDTRTTMLPSTLRVAALGVPEARRCAQALRGLTDPEDPLTAAATMPRSLALAELLGGLPTPAAIATAWAAAGPDPAPRALVGMALDGEVDIDLVRDGPHGLIAGTTGAGKSELLRTLVIGMAANSSPEHLALVLVDYKGGATFDACSTLPHVVGVITDLDDQMAERALRSLHAELRRREGVLREHKAADLAALKHAAPTIAMPRLVVVVDEFAALVAEQPAFLHALVGVAQRGRSLGIHLLLATQRPSGVISDDIRANTNLRLALRLQDNTDAVDVVGVATPATLPRHVPGRAVLRLGADDHVTFQTAHCTVHGLGVRSALAVMVNAITEAAGDVGCAPPAAPWQPPLPDRLGEGDLPHGAIGLVDDPDHQRTLPLTWSPADGHVLVAGSVGSGVTSTLRTLAVCATAAGADVYVLDGRGAIAHDDLAAHPRCGGVVRLHERERLTRLLHRFRSQARGTADEPRPAVLVIDGLDTARRALDDTATTDEYEALAEVLAAAAGRGITIVAGVEHAATVPSGFLARCPSRWVLHLHDPHDAAILGVPAASVPPAVAGRAAIAGHGLTAQLLAPGPIAAAITTHTSAAPAPRITAVPAVIDPATLPAGHFAGGATELPLGIGFDDDGPALLRLHPGDHALVVGAARTGRTRALVRLATAWREAHPDGWVGVIAPRRTFPALAVVANASGSSATVIDALSGPADRPVLLVVDDADLVDDPDGRLASLDAPSTGAAGHVTVVAAARPDGLRQAYGHWTGLLRRSRIGLVATGGNDLDGDLLGAVLPRRAPIAPRPGLMWLVDGGRHRLVQVAADCVATDGA